jgi:hypothetical protein
MPNDKPLKPDDFPVEFEGDELMTADGKPNRQGENARHRRGYRGPVSTKTITAKSRTDGRRPVSGVPRRDHQLNQAATSYPRGVAPVRCMKQTCAVRPR